MKKILVSLLIVGLLPGYVFAEVYAIETSKGSFNRGKFHTETCDFVKIMKPEYLMSFQTAQQAVKAGFKPCKVCKPK